MDAAPNIMVGLPDLMHAGHVEARRVMAEHRGDFVAEQKDVLDRLVTTELISAEEAETLLGLYVISYEAGEPKGNAQRAYFETRDRYTQLLANNRTSPVALVIASSALGSFEISEDSGGSTVITIARVSYGSSLAGIGAYVGGVIGGKDGAVIGGAVGGLLGGIIDDKKDKK